MNIDELLSIHDRPSDIIRDIYQHQKKINYNFSLQYLCNKSGIPSRSLLSDIMRKRRKLKLQYAIPLAQALGLNLRQQRFFEILSKLENAKDLKTQETLQKKIKNARKRMLVKSSTLFHGDFDPFIFAKAYSALGIYGKKKTLENISKIIGESLVKTRNALDALVKQKWIEHKNGLYKIKDSGQVRFTGSDRDSFHLTLIENAIQNSLLNLKYEYTNSKDTFFDSSTISVSYKNYLKILNRLKETIDEVQSEMEVAKGDGLVHFNIQVFPQRES